MDVISYGSWYDVGMVLAWFCNGFGMSLVWCCYGCGMSLVRLLLQKKMKIECLGRHDLGLLQGIRHGTVGSL
jgi:hypothetical protein